MYAIKIFLLGCFQFMPSVAHSLLTALSLPAAAEPSSIVLMALVLAQPLLAGTVILIIYF